MISLEAWRVRIGNFCFSSKIRPSVNRYRVTSMNSHGTKLRVSDVLLTYLCLCFTSVAVYELKQIIKIATYEPISNAMVEPPCVFGTIGLPVIEPEKFSYITCRASSP